MVHPAQSWILTVLLCNWIPLIIYAKGKAQSLPLNSILFYLLPSNIQQTTGEILFRSAKKSEREKL